MEDRMRKLATKIKHHAERENFELRKMGEQMELWGRWCYFCSGCESFVGHDLVTMPVRINFSTEMEKRNCGLCPVCTRLLIAYLVQDAVNEGLTAVESDRALVVEQKKCKTE